MLNTDHYRNTYGYKVVLVKDDLVELHSPEFGRQPWLKVKTRRAYRCAVMEDIIPAGDMAYRPLTNGHNRMHRISEAGMKRLRESLYPM